MKILLRNHHTPYLWLLATALPECEFAVLSSVHAPTGWRNDQRPLPPNVHVVNHAQGSWDVALLQAPEDLALFPDNESRRYAYVAHNLSKFEGIARFLSWRAIPLIATSSKKRESFVRDGFTGRVWTVEPGLPLEQFPPWRGGGGYVLTVANNLRRPLFVCDAWCELVDQLQKRLGLPTRLVGEGNEGLPGAVGPATSWDALREEYQRCALYLDPIDPENENDFNLALMEAEATGCPMLYLKGEGDHSIPLSYLMGSVPRLLEETLLWRVEQKRHEFRRRYPSFEQFSERWRLILEGVAQ